MNNELAALKAASVIIQPEISTWSDYDLVASIRFQGMSTKLKVDEGKMAQGKIYTMDLQALLREESKRMRKSSHLMGVAQVFSANKTIVAEPGRISVSTDQGKIEPVNHFAAGIPCATNSQGMSIAIATAAMTTVYGIEAKGNRTLSIPDSAQKLYSNQPVFQLSDRLPSAPFHFGYKALTEGGSTIDQRDRLAKAIHDKGTMTFGGYVLTRYQPHPNRPETNVKRTMTQDNITRLQKSGYEKEVIPDFQFAFAPMPSVKITAASFDNLMAVIDAHRSVRGADKGKISLICSMMYMGELPVSLSQSIVEAVAYRAVHDRFLKLYPKLVGLSVPSSVNSTVLDLLRNHLILHNNVSPNILTFSAAYKKTFQKKPMPTVVTSPPVIVTTTTISPSPSPSPSPSITSAPIKKPSIPTTTKLSLIKPEDPIQSNYDESAGKIFGIPMSDDLVGADAYNHLLSTKKHNCDYQVPATHCLRILKYPIPAPTFTQGKLSLPSTNLSDLAQFRDVVMAADPGVLYEVFAYPQMFTMPEISCFEHPIPHRNMIYVMRKCVQSQYTFVEHFKRVIASNVWRTNYPFHRRVYWKYDEAYAYRPLLISRGFLKTEHHELGYIIELDKGAEQVDELDGVDDEEFKGYLAAHPFVSIGDVKTRGEFGMGRAQDVLIPAVNNNANIPNNSNMTPQNTELSVLAAAAANTRIVNENEGIESYAEEDVGYTEDNNY